MAVFQEYGFFDSEITGYDDEGFPILDRAQNSEMFALFYSKLISNGVLATPANCLMVEAYDGMRIKVNPGYVVIAGHFGYNTKEEILTVDAAHTSMCRITSVVARLNYTERYIELILKNGEPAVSPETPEIFQPSSGDYYELCLAEIKINSNQAVITQSAITDTRADSAKCGYVTQLIDHIDTKVFYAQFLSFYEEFVNKAEVSFQEFTDMMTTYLAELKISGNEQLNAIIKSIEEFEKQSEISYGTWFQHMKDQLSEDAAGKLQIQIDTLTQSMFERYYGLVVQNTEFMSDGSIVQENAEAIVITKFGTDENSNKQIIQTITVKSTQAQYVKITTIFPATESSNKKIVESYTAPMSAVYLSDLLKVTGIGGIIDGITINDIGEGLALSDDGTLSVDKVSIVDAVAESITDYSKAEVSEIYNMAERNAIITDDEA